MSEPRTIAVLGGSGALGQALAKRWGAAGHRIVIGSRSAARAQEIAATLGGAVRGMVNRDAAAASEIVAVAVPYEAHRAILEEIRDAVAGKIVVDATVPLKPPRVARVQLPPSGSAAKEAQEILGEGVKIVAAFHTIAAHRLATGETVDCDVLVFGNDPAARETVIGLVADAGLTGWHAGAIDNSAAAEAMTSVLIFLNRRYGIDGAGFRITGTPTKTGATQEG